MSAVVLLCPEDTVLFQSTLTSGFDDLLSLSSAMVLEHWRGDIDILFVSEHSTGD